MSEDVLKCRSTEPYLSSHINSVGCKLGLPVSGTFELTSRCNFSCPMCYIHSSENTIDEISAGKWISLAEEAKEEGLMFLLLTGGEPLMRRDFADIYTSIVKMGILVSVNTNASLFTDEIRELFRKYPPVRINVSLYGASNSCYGKMCGNEAFERVYENLKKMKEDSLNVRLNVSLTPFNSYEYERISDISKELNLQSKATAYMYPPVRIGSDIGKNSGRFDAVEAGKQMALWYSVHDSAEKFSSRAQIMADDTHHLPSSDSSMCRAGRSSFWITSDGKMLPCGTMDIEPSDPFADGFRNAWEETKEKVKNIRMPEECTVCSMRDYCGVCAAICKDETGDFSTVPEYVCKLSKTLKDEVIRIYKERQNADS